MTALRDVAEPAEGKSVIFHCASAKRLSELGFKQDAKRHFSRLTSFGLSASMCSVLVGIIPLYGQSLSAGGPAVMMWSWLALGVFSLVHVCCLAEMASAFPCSGTLYYWAYRVGGRKWGPFASWLTGWLSLLGQVAGIGAASYSAAAELGQLVVLFGGIRPDASILFVIFLCLLFLSSLTNMLTETLLTATSYVSIAVHLVGSVCIVGVLLAGATNAGGLQSPSFVLGGFINETGFPSPIYAGLIGLLSAGTTYTGYDTAASVAEETVDSLEETPRSMIMSVLAATVMGLLIILGLNMSVQDVTSIMAATGPGEAFSELVSQTGVGHAAAVGMNLILFVAMQCAASANVTSASRLIYSFSRDKALPFSSYWSTMHSGLNSPVRAIWLSASLAAVIGIVGLSANLTQLFFSVSTVALYASYLIPVLCRVTVGSELEYDTASWKLGSWSRPLCYLASAHCLFMTVVLSLPMTSGTLNYAGPDVLVTLALALLSWHVSAKHWYQRPVSLPKRQLPNMDSVTTMQTDLSDGSIIDQNSEHSPSHENAQLSLALTVGFTRAFPSSEDLGLPSAPPSPVRVQFLPLPVPSSLAELMGEAGPCPSPSTSALAPKKMSKAPKKQPGTVVAAPAPISLMELQDQV